ncbi:sodium-dependent transporter [Aliikangiella coralliicola]|uniref:Sodium-dependent transporter n=1 Tax=Aliikangiella coralliicola TaxID=2592383 RepID=A0A545U643_9GAMM|nr:sodium-dependent transporter [Aliikangiella coralliicola]TQV84894.1 sodium-dependent transporter [Aliikangiella coralliicola]
MAVQRGGFSTRMGFILAAAGSAVGLGNIWKFPFEVGQGGGAAFVVLYLTCCFVLCFPVLVAEIAIGRKTRRNAVGAFKALGYHKWAFIGYLGLTSGVLILSFYNVVAAWALGYFVEMVTGNFGIGKMFGDFTADYISVGLYSILFMGGTAFVVSRGVSGGIERAAKILMPTLFIMVLCLIIYAMTLPNAVEGLKFYLVPDFSQITGQVVYSALGQAFFSLSLGMGALITYGSYVNREDNIVSSASLITLTDVGVAVLAGFMIFPFVFSQGIETDGGAGLIFITLPGVFESLGSTLGVVIGGLFFLLLSFAAFTSTISLLEVPTSYMVDEHKIERSKATWIVALIIFAVGIPSLLSNGAVEALGKFASLPGTGTLDFMTFVGLIANDLFLPLGGFLIAVFTIYVWKKENFNEELTHGDSHLKGSWLQSYVNFALSYICPLLLGLIFLVTVLDSFFGVKLINILLG